MSEQQLSSNVESPLRTIVFITILSFVCALILSVLASALAEPKEIAKDLDRSKQMMIAAKILSHEGYFIMPDEKGNYIPAKYENGKLVPGTVYDIATKQQLLDVYRNALKPYLVDAKGELRTFEDLNLNEDKYTAEFKKTGYYLQPNKLIYAIYPLKGKDDSNQRKPTGWVIPVNGFGLWDAIYGYLALKPDGNTVIGTSWYDQKETPGLGANISEAYWQDLFPGKVIFQENSSGKTDFKLAPVGIIVVKGKVSEVLGSSPKSKSAVDGMAGATLTGNGVTDAFKTVLNAYRPFLIKINETNDNKEKG